MRRLNPFPVKAALARMSASTRIVVMAGGAIVVSLLLPGCATNAANRSNGNTKGVPAHTSGRGSITEINMMTGPVAVNLDRHPDLDGISVRLFFSEADRPKAVVIPSGGVDVLMFDGLFIPGKDAPPLRKVWTFTAAELESVRYESSLGMAYELLLPWGEDAPDSRAISVVARYNRPDGTYLLSGSSSISVMDAFRTPRSK
jgi:hypothetical protein